MNSSGAQKLEADRHSGRRSRTRFHTI
jgi:hypothetical protein